MIENPNCAVCDSQDWEEIGRRTYAAADVDTADEYVRRRLRVLFEIWFSGETEVTLRSLLCRKCGFVTYAPRPDPDDIDRKYRFLTSLGRDSNTPEIDSRTERLRAARLWKKLRGGLGKQSRILDFGGGDGRLMRHFAENGHQCFVVDYSPTTVPGVQRLASTLEELPAGSEFDMVVCGHVIEHVAEPLNILQTLAGMLRDDGFIYVEVPMEIWRNAPLHEEPVTHVNFFTTQSMRVLLARAGYSELDVRLEAYEYVPRHMLSVVAASARRRAGVNVALRFRGAADSTRGLLNPSLALRVRRALLTPSKIPASVANRIRSLVASK